MQNDDVLGLEAAGDAGVVSLASVLVIPVFTIAEFFAHECRGGGDFVVESGDGDWSSAHGCSVGGLGSRRSAARMSSVAFASSGMGVKSSETRWRIASEVSTRTMTPA